MPRKTTSSTPSSHAASPYVDALGRTDAESYLEGVLDGSVPAGRHMRTLAATMLPRIRDGYKGWRYSVDHALRVVEFFETFLCYPSGKLGVPFALEPYERMILELAFGFVGEDGTRQFRYLLCELARKNGKTSLAAGIELYMLVADGEGAPQVYNAATSKAQASLGYGAAWRMVKQSPQLKRRLRKGIVPERQEDGIICDSNMGYVCTLSKQSAHLDGLDVHCAVMDELAAETDRAAFDLVRQGTGARDQSMIVAITTQGFVRDNIWDNERAYGIGVLEGDIEDDTMLPILFELDDRSEVFDESAWPKANPGLGTVKKWDYMRAQAQKARNDPSYLPTFLTKDLNMPANQSAAWLRFEECVNEAPLPEADFKYAIVGFDASDTTDLSAARAIMMLPGDDHLYERSMYWVPEESVRLRDGNSQRERDDVPYHQWQDRGLMRLVPGNKVDKMVLIEWLRELYDEGIYPFAVGYDPWHMDDSTLRDLKAFVGESRVVPVRQGAQTLSQPMMQFRAELRDGMVVDGHNPVNEWCRMNVKVKTDTNGNIQPDKKGGPKTRIDGFMAEIDAYVVLQNMWADYQSAIC